MKKIVGILFLYVFLLNVYIYLCDIYRYIHVHHTYVDNSSNSNPESLAIFMFMIPKIKKTGGAHQSCESVFISL